MGFRHYHHGRARAHAHGHAHGRAHAHAHGRAHARARGCDHDVFLTYKLEYPTWKIYLYNRAHETTHSSHSEPDLKNVNFWKDGLQKN